MTDELVLDSREQAILHQACQLADNAARVQALVEEDGLMIAGSTGQQRMHPGLSEIRQSQGQIGRLLGLLKPADHGTAGGMRASMAARRRWRVP